MMVFYLMNFFFTIIELNNKILIFDVDLVFFLNNDIKENNSLNYIFQDYMELFVDPHQNYTFLLEIIIKYLKLDERKKVKVINLSPFALKAINQGKLSLTLPSLVTTQGNVETQIFQICKILLQILPQLRTFLLGEGEQANEIATIKSQLKEGKQLRKHLNKYLQGRTFFVGNHITFADFYMFTQLYDNLIDLNDEQKSQYNNVFRWYKHIQNLPQILEYLKASNRFIIQDPQLKIPFLADKKKSKEKKDKKKQEKKQQVVVVVEKQAVKQEPKVQVKVESVQEVV